MAQSKLLYNTLAQYRKPNMTIENPPRTSPASGNHNCLRLRRGRFLNRHSGINLAVTVADYCAVNYTLKRHVLTMTDRYPDPLTPLLPFLECLISWFGPALD